MADRKQGKKEVGLTFWPKSNQDGCGFMVSVSDSQSQPFLV